MKTAAIPTIHRGVQMRSLAEARWAAFFDYMGWVWDYEPMEFEGWIPDFVLNGKVLVEVKGGALSFEELKRDVGKARHPTLPVLLFGAAPFWDQKLVGYIRHHNAWRNHLPHDETCEADDLLNISGKKFKGHHCLNSDEGPYNCELCGRRTVGTEEEYELSLDWAQIRMFWNLAKNQVQYKSPKGSGVRLR